MDGTVERLRTAVARVLELLDGCSPSEVAVRVTDDVLLRALGAVGDARKALDLVAAALSSEVERRSARERGYEGLAQRRGHRTGTALIQSLTGQTAADIRRVAGIGKDLAEAEAAVAGDGGARADDVGTDDGRDAVTPWFAPLTAALRAGVLSPAQFAAIRDNLGEPPVRDGADPDAVAAVWRAAAERLIEEAAALGVEDLRSAARLARDTLDPEGTRMRFEERFARRSFTMWVDEHGQHNARLRLDDDAAAWVRTILNAALRPRRGPRFVPADAGTGESEPGTADARGDHQDDRSNEQLQYDTILAILRTGAQADPAQAFGDRQPGVRIVTTVGPARNAEGGRPASGVGHYEETGQTIPAGVVESYLCNAGARDVTIDPRGRPLDVGRDQRLFTPRQRVAISIRDGGCLWCGAEPSRCEVHHILHWVRDRGRTDTDDGVLLCRNCHLRLHNQGWRIRRDGTTYWLHPPPGDGRPPMRLRPRGLLRYRSLRAGGSPASAGAREQERVP